MKTDNLQDSIEHAGVISDVNSTDSIVVISLSASPECEGCAASRLCGNANPTNNRFTVRIQNAKEYQVGEKVILRGSERLHRKAVMIATVVPTATLIAVMFVMYAITRDQGIAALCGLGSMVFFFVSLWLSRNKLAHEFTFEIIKKPTDL